MSIGHDYHSTLMTGNDGGWRHRAWRAMKATVCDRQRSDPPWNALQEGAGRWRSAVIRGSSLHDTSSAVIYFEDLKIGERSLVGTHAVSKEEAIEFARKWEPQPYHVDEAAAETSLYGGLTVCSLYLFAVCTRLFFQREDQIAVTAMLGKDEVRLPKPARPGDSLAYYTECVAKRASRTRPDSGVVTLLDTLCNAAGETVLTQKVRLLVSRRGSAD